MESKYVHITCSCGHRETLEFRDAEHARTRHQWRNDPRRLDPNRLEFQADLRGESSTHKREGYGCVKCGWK